MTEIILKMNQCNVVIYSKESRHVLTAHLATQNIKFDNIIMFKDEESHSLKCFESMKQNINLFFIGCYLEKWTDTLLGFKSVTIFDIKVSTQVYFLFNKTPPNFDLHLNVERSSYDMMIDYLAEKHLIFPKKPWIAEYVEDSFNFPFLLPDSLDVNVAIIYSKIIESIQNSLSKPNNLCLHSISFDGFKAKGLSISDMAKKQVELDISSSTCRPVNFQSGSFIVWVSSCKNNRQHVAMRLLNTEASHILNINLVCFHSFDPTTNLYSVEYIGRDAIESYKSSMNLGTPISQNNIVMNYDRSMFVAMFGVLPDYKRPQKFFKKNLSIKDEPSDNRNRIWRK